MKPRRYLRDSEWRLTAGRRLAWLRKRCRPNEPCMNSRHSFPLKGNVRVGDGGVSFTVRASCAASMCRASRLYMQRLTHPILKRA